MPTEEEATGVFPFDVIVTVEELPVTGLGLNEAVTPAGRLEALRLTAPLNPPERLMDTVKEPVDPSRRFRELWADREKFPLAAS